MRKLLLLLMLLMAVPAIGSAQIEDQEETTKPSPSITRVLLGCTLTETTKDQAKAEITSRGGELVEEKLDPSSPRIRSLIYSGLTFSGRKIKQTELTFLDSTLASIEFTFLDKKEADDIKQLLSDKYPDWVRNADATLVDKHMEGVYDAKTVILLTYIYKEGFLLNFESARLKYADRLLVDKLFEARTSEL